MADRRWARVVLVVVSGVMVADAAAASPQSRDAGVVVVSGEGVVQAVPDRAWVNVTSESRASSAREAQRRNADAMRPVQDRLRAAGLPADAMRTAAYDLQQEWDFVNDRRVSRGYVARNTVEIRVDSIDRLGEFLEIAVGSGATSVGGVRFDVRERATLEREALRLAGADARARAESAAAGIGRTIRAVVRVEEQGVPVQPVAPLMAMRVAAESSDAPVFEAGQMELRALVTLTAELN